MSKATIAQATTLSDEHIDRILDATADSFVLQLRSPILHAPSEQDLDYEEVSFPARRGDWPSPESLLISLKPHGNWSKKRYTAAIRPSRAMMKSVPA